MSKKTKKEILIERVVMLGPIILVGGIILLEMFYF
jgi:hypothetical protein